MPFGEIPSQLTAGKSPLFAEETLARQKELLELISPENDSTIFRAQVSGKSVPLRPAKNVKVRDML